MWVMLLSFLWMLRPSIVLLTFHLRKNILQQEKRLIIVFQKLDIQITFTESRVQENNNCRWGIFIYCITKLNEGNYFHNAGDDGFW